MSIREVVEMEKHLSNCCLNIVLLALTSGWGLYWDPSVMVDISEIGAKLGI